MYLELVLETLPGADRDLLHELLRAKGFDPLPMKVGLLLSGELEALGKLLPGLVGTETGELPIPEELKNAVRSIRIFKPRSLH
jgi:ribosomal 50S subunit-associated protein YjgA (DUF615 family)